MNPYLEKLKSEKGVPTTLPLLTQAPSVSIGSGIGRGFSEITRPSVSNGSGVGTPFSKIDLVNEFVEIDGMTFEDAERLAEQCPQPRRPEEWLGLIAELDRLICVVCKRDGLDDQACQRILAGRKCQALSTIPLSLQWYRTELGLK